MADKDARGGAARIAERKEAYSLASLVLSLSGSPARRSLSRSGRSNPFSLCSRYRTCAWIIMYVAGSYVLVEPATDAFPLASDPQCNYPAARIVSHDVTAFIVL